MRGSLFCEVGEDEDAELLSDGWGEGVPFPIDGVFEHRGGKPLQVGAGGGLEVVPGLLQGLRLLLVGVEFGLDRLVTRGVVVATLEELVQESFEGVHVDA